MVNSSISKGVTRELDGYLNSESNEAQDFFFQDLKTGP